MMERDMVKAVFQEGNSGRQRDLEDGRQAATARVLAQAEVLYEGADSVNGNEQSQERYHLLQLFPLSWIQSPPFPNTSSLNDLNGSWA